REPPRHRRQEAVEAAWRDVAGRVPGRRLRAGCAPQLPRAPRVGARRRDDGDVARRDRRAVHARARGLEPGHLRLREARLDERRLSESHDPRRFCGRAGDVPRRAGLRVGFGARLESGRDRAGEDRAARRVPRLRRVPVSRCRARCRAARRFDPRVGRRRARRRRAVGRGADRERAQGALREAGPYAARRVSAGSRRRHGLEGVARSLREPGAPREGHRPRAHPPGRAASLQLVSAPAVRAPAEFEERLRSYYFERSEEERAVRVGEKEISEQAAIVERYADLFSRPQLEALRAAEEEASDDERERLVRLRLTCEEGLADAELTAREDELENGLLAARVDWEGEELPLRSAQARLATLTGYRDRDELGTRALAVSIGFNEERRAILAARNEIEAELSGHLDAVERNEDVK